MIDQLLRQKSSKSGNGKFDAPPAAFDLLVGDCLSVQVQAKNPRGLFLVKHIISSKDGGPRTMSTWRNWISSKNLNNVITGEYQKVTYVKFIKKINTSSFDTQALEAGKLYLQRANEGKTLEQLEQHRAKDDPEEAKTSATAKLMEKLSPEHRALVEQFKQRGAIAAPAG